MMNYNNSFNLPPIQVRSAANKHIKCARDCLTAKDYNNALFYANQAIMIDPSFYGHYKTRGEARLKLGDYHGAIADFDNHIAYNPTPNLDSGMTAQLRGEAKLMLGDYRGAIADLNSGLFKWSSTYFKLGMAKEELIDYHGAIEAYNNCITKNDDAALVSQAQQKIWQLKGILNAYAPLISPKPLNLSSQNLLQAYKPVQTSTKSTFPLINFDDDEIRHDTASEESDDERDYMDEFFELVEDGDLSGMQRLVQSNKVEADVRNTAGESALHHAAASDHLHIVKWLIKTQGLDNDIEDDKGATPLHWAAKRGALSVVQWLVEKQRVNLERTDNKGRTALHYAAKNGATSVVSYLVEHEADSEATDNQGRTALDCASANDIIQYLQSPELFIKKAEAFVRQQRHDEALTYYLKALERQPRQANTIVAVGNLFNTLARYEEALTYFDQAFQYSNAQNSTARAGKMKALFELGNQWGRKKDYAAALDYYQQAMGLDPRNTLYLNQAGNALRLLKRYPEAIELFDKVLALNASDSTAQQEKRLAISGYVNQLLEESEGLLAQQHYTQAYSKLQQALTLESQNLAVLLKLAQVAEGLQQPDQALEYYTRVLQLDSRHAYALDRKSNLLDQKAQACFDQSQYAQAKVYYQQLVNLKPQQTAYLIQLARTCHQLGHYQEAITYFDKGLTINPGNREWVTERDRALLAQANLLFQQGRYPEAINGYGRVSHLTLDVCVPLLTQAIQLEKANQLADALIIYRLLEKQSYYAHHSAFLGALGFLLKKQEKPSDALDYFNRALASKETSELAPLPRLSITSLLGAKGELLAQQQRYADALACYQSAYEQDAAALSLCLPLGELCNRLGRYEEALSYFEKAVSLPAGSSQQVLSGQHQALFGLGQQAVQQQQYEHAIAYFQKALVLDKHNRLYLLSLGTAFYQAKHFEEALTCLNNLLQLDPSYKDALTQKQLIQAAYAQALAQEGDQLVNQQQFEVALARYQKAIQLQPEPHYYYTAGVVLQQLNREAEALSSYNQVLALDAQHFQALAKKADILLAQAEHAWQTHDYPAALKNYLQLTQYYPKNKAFWLGTGRAVQQLHHYQDALNYYQTVLTLDVQNAEAYRGQHQSLNALGEEQAGQQQWQKALTFFQQAIHFDTKNALYLGNAGNMLHRLGRFLDALNMFDEALTVLPQDKALQGQKQATLVAYAQHLAVQAQTCFDQTQYAQAFDHYQKAYHLQSHEIAYAVGAGQALLAQQRYTEAAVYYQKALTIDPTAFSALLGQATCEGYEASATSKHLDALKAFKQALQWAQNDKTLLVAAAHSAGEIHSFEEALAYCDQALKNDISFAAAKTEKQRLIKRQAEWQFHILLEQLRTSEARLTTLSLKDIVPDTDRLRALITALRNNSVIEQVDASGCSISESDWIYLLDALATCPRLFRLNCSAARVALSTLEHFSAVADRFGYLMDLDLSHNALESKSAALLTKLLLKLPSLEQLNISHNLLGDKGVEQVSTALKKHATLIELNLAANQITTGLKAISEMLKTNRSVMHLNLNQNQLSDIKPLLDVLKVNPVLTKLTLNHNPIKIGLSSLFKALAKNRSVTQLEIELQNTSFTAKLPSLLEALKTNVTLTHLLIASDDVTKAKIASSLLRNSQSRDELHQAAKAGNITLAKKALLQGVNLLSTTDDVQNSALHWAVQAGQEAMCKLLLEWAQSLKIPLDSLKNYRNHAQVSPYELAQRLNNAALTTLLTPVKLSPSIARVKIVSPTISTASPLPSPHKHQTVDSLEMNLHVAYPDITFGAELGRGGFGIVYKGTYHYHEVAIKQLFNAQLSNTAVDEFRKEMEMMAQLRSPNIVQLYGICQEIGRYCIVMEYMPKGSLYSVLHSQEPLSWTQRESIALDIAKGLAYLHQGQLGYQILHRDLKSLNVLLDAQYRAKLTDFGLSKVKQEVTSKSSMSSSKAVGTLAWMAPELFETKPQYTVKSDIYGYGMVLWELSARQVPFKDVANPGIVAAQICMGKRADIPQDTPPKIAKLITFCWAQDPNKRPTSSQIISELQATQDSHEVTTISNTAPVYEDNLASQNVSTASDPRYYSNTYSQR